MHATDDDSGYQATRRLLKLHPRPDAIFGYNDPTAAGAMKAILEAGIRIPEEIKVIGLRRLIAQRMSEAKRTIPHFAYVEELDITELESLRRHLNGRLPAGSAPLTYLPFLALGLIRVLREFPQCNAHYDAERGVILRYSAVPSASPRRLPRASRCRWCTTPRRSRCGSSRPPCAA